MTNGYDNKAPFRGSLSGEILQLKEIAKKYNNLLEQNDSLRRENQDLKAHIQELKERLHK